MASDRRCKVRNPGKPQENPALTSIFRFGEVQYGTRLKVKKAAVKGKAILCGGTLSEWRKEWLFESKKDY